MMLCRLPSSLALLCLGSSLTQAFQSTTITAKLAFLPRQQQQHAPPLFMSSFAADGSEYSSKDSDYDDDDLTQKGMEFRDDDLDDDDDDKNSPVVELSPVPMSKNTGNRFVALIWDQELNKDSPSSDRDELDLHYDRDALTEDHVMFCRKRNLYNETFNSDSMVDILRSMPM
jgi:hypothetical protein